MMGVSEKPHFQTDVGDMETEIGNGKKWMIGGIPLQSPLKPVFTKKKAGTESPAQCGEEESSTTPTAEESRIQSRMPPAPRKRKPRSSSNRCINCGAREFFIPPNDLETVFKRRAERA